MASPLARALLGAEAALAPEKTRSFKHEFQTHSERGAALDAVAQVDADLESLIRAYMIKTSLQDQALKETGPIGPLGVRIKIAYLFGMIPKMLMQELDIIRKIRNEFAHTPNAVDFNYPKIKVACSELSIVPTIRSLPRERMEVFYSLLDLYDVDQPPYLFVATCMIVRVLIGIQREYAKPSDGSRLHGTKDAV